MFSTKAVIVKKAFQDTHIDAVSLLAVRMAFSLPFYPGVAFFAGNQKDNVHFTRRQWLSIAVLGLFGYYISSFLDFEGLQFISAGLERLILFLYPTFVVLINAFLFRQKITGIQKIALLLTYAGIGIAYFGEMKVDFSNPGFLSGSFFNFSLCGYLLHLHCRQRKINSSNWRHKIYHLCNACSNRWYFCSFYYKKQLECFLQQ